MGSIGKPCMLQNVRYELRADVYAPKVDESREKPNVIDRSLIKRSKVQGCLWGCLDAPEILIIFWATTS